MSVLVLAALALAGSTWWDNAANRGMPRGAAGQPIKWADVPRGGVNVVGLEQEVVTPEQRASGDNKVARTFRMIREAGFHLVRMDFPWEDLEVCSKADFRDHCRPGGKGQSTWTKYDYIVDQARANGLDMIVRLDRPPAWARKAALASPEVRRAEAAVGNVTGPPDRFGDYADFVAAVAHRYRGRLRFYQIWNEPNLPGEWNYRRQDSAEFVRLLKLAGAAIKGQDPDGVILFPALSPTDGADRTAVNDLEYLQGVYDAGGRDAFDIMSAQFYGLGQPPDEHRYVTPGSSLLRPIETRADVSRVVLLHEIMIRNGDAGKAVWISELGWNSAPPALHHQWGRSVTEEQKAQYLAGAMERARREWPWVGAMCVWMFRWGGEPPNPRDPTPYFQIVDFNFNPLPAYRVVEEYLHAPHTGPLAAGNPAATAVTGAGVMAVVGAATWLWPTLTEAAALAAGAVVLAARKGRAAGGRAMARTGAPALYRRRIGSSRIAIVCMAVGIAIFYRGSAQLPITLLGALIFILPALIRPDLALLAVVAALPLYLAPKGVWDKRFGLSRPEGYFLPLHEFVLLVAAAGSLRFAGAIRQGRAGFLSALRSIWPILPFLLAGSLGVVVAGRAGRATALREWRWLIVEPLIFYALVRLYGRSPAFRSRLLWTWLGTGVVVALIALLQVVGLDLSTLIKGQRCFSEAVVASGGVERATSVYCHPNNLGLALGRVWPVLAALALGTGASLGAFLHPYGIRRRLGQLRSEGALLPAALALVVLAGLGVSFSKGALLGAFAALVVLGVALRRRVLLWAAAAGALGVIAVGAASGIERLNPLGGSSGARLELWGSGLAMLRDHPWFGIGLDQFFRLRNHDAAGPYISAQAATTSERFASHPHNLMLDILLRVGLLGFVAFAALLVRFFRRANSVLSNGSCDERWIAAGLLAAMVAAIVHGLVDNFYFVADLAFVFWLQMALVDVMFTEPAKQKDEAG